MGRFARFLIGSVSLMGVAAHAPGSTSRHRPAEPDQRQRWLEASNRLLDQTKSNGEQWRYSRCEEYTNLGPSTHLHGNPVIYFWPKDLRGRSREWAVASGGGQFLELMPTEFRAESSAKELSKARTRRLFGKKVWEGTVWEGEGSEVAPFWAPDSVPVTYQEEGGRKIVTVVSGPWSGSATSFFDPSTPRTAYFVQRFDNQGNFVNLHVLVDKNGKQIFSVKMTCGNGFGHKVNDDHADPTSPAKGAPEDQREIQQRLHLFSRLPFRDDIPHERS